MAGGRYQIDPKSGERKLVEAPTRDHPHGNCARDADGTPLFPAIGAEAQPPAPAPKKPVGPASSGQSGKKE